MHTAFYAVYVTKERRSSVQAMQLSNGLTNPIGLWLGHLMFDVIWSILLSSIIIIIFATVSNKFHGLGFLVCFFSRCLKAFILMMSGYITVGGLGALWLRRRPLFVLHFFNSDITSSSLCDGRRISVSHKHCEYLINQSILGWADLVFFKKLYLASPLLVLTYGKATESSNLITIIHFTTSIVAPVASVVSHHSYNT